MRRHLQVFGGGAGINVALQIAGASPLRALFAAVILQVSLYAFFEVRP